MFHGRLHLEVAVSGAAIINSFETFATIAADSFLQVALAAFIRAVDFFIDQLPPHIFAIYSNQV